MKKSASAKEHVEHLRGRWAFLAIFNPLMLPTSCCRRRFLERVSICRMKMYGDKGSPCLKPALGEILPVGSPFTKTEYVIVEMHCMMR